MQINIHLITRLFDKNPDYRAHNISKEIELAY